MSTQFVPPVNGLPIPPMDVPKTRGKGKNAATRQAMRVAAATADAPPVIDAEIVEETPTMTLSPIIGQYQARAENIAFESDSVTLYADASLEDWIDAIKGGLKFAQRSMFDVAEAFNVLKKRAVETEFYRTRKFQVGMVTFGPFSDVKTWAEAEFSGAFSYSKIQQYIRVLEFWKERIDTVALHTVEVPLLDAIAAKVNNSKATVITKQNVNPDAKVGDKICDLVPSQSYTMEWAQRAIVFRMDHLHQTAKWIHEEIGTSPDSKVARYPWRDGLLPRDKDGKVCSIAIAAAESASDGEGDSNGGSNDEINSVTLKFEGANKTALKLLMLKKNLTTKKDIADFLLKLIELTANK